MSEETEKQKTLFLGMDRKGSNISWEKAPPCHALSLSLRSSKNSCGQRRDHQEETWSQVKAGAAVANLSLFSTVTQEKCHGHEQNLGAAGEERGSGVVGYGAQICCMEAALKIFFKIMTTMC